MTSNDPCRIQKEVGALFGQRILRLSRAFQRPLPSARPANTGEADPTGSESFCFQKRVVKDAELVRARRKSGSRRPEPSASAALPTCGRRAASPGNTRARRRTSTKPTSNCSATANRCSIRRCSSSAISTATSSAPTSTARSRRPHEFTNEQIDEPEDSAAFSAPCSPIPISSSRSAPPRKSPKSSRQQIAEVARSLQSRESVELADAKRAGRLQRRATEESSHRPVSQSHHLLFLRRGHRLAAEKPVFRNCQSRASTTRSIFAERSKSCFAIMAKGGTFRRSQDSPFQRPSLSRKPPSLNSRKTKSASSPTRPKPTGNSSSRASWARSFERALDPRPARAARRALHQRGRHQDAGRTGADGAAPPRMERSSKRPRAQRSLQKQRQSRDRAKLPRAFHKKLAAITVLDPACGSGNFLYVSLQLLLDLEKEVITFATQLGFKFKPQVSVQQLHAIEINPYAFELAQVSVQIGYLQWRRDNGFQTTARPSCKISTASKTKTRCWCRTSAARPRRLKEAQAGNTRRKTR